MRASKNFYSKFVTLEHQSPLSSSTYSDFPYVIVQQLSRHFLHKKSYNNFLASNDISVVIASGPLFHVSDSKATIFLRGLSLLLDGKYIWVPRKYNEKFLVAIHEFNEAFARGKITIP